MKLPEKAAAVTALSGRHATFTALGLHREVCTVGRFHSLFAFRLYFLNVGQGIHELL